MGKFWGACPKCGQRSPFGWYGLFLPVPLLPESTWYVLLFSKGTQYTKRLVCSASDHNRGLLQCWGRVWEAPVFGPWGSWGLLWRRRSLRRGQGRKHRRGYYGTGQWAFPTLDEFPKIEYKFSQLVQPYWGMAD